MTYNPPLRTSALALTLVLAGCAPSAESILARNIEALGGRDAIRRVASLKITGTQTVEGGKIGLTGYWRRPNQLRWDFEVDGLIGVQAYDGENGWSLMPFSGDFTPRPLQGEALEEIAAQADLLEGPTFDLAAKGASALLLGREALDGVPAWKVELTDARGRKTIHWYDGESGLEVANLQRRRGPGGVGEIEVVTRLGDYRRVGPLLFAFRAEESSSASAVPAILTLDTIDLDVEIPDELWTMPPAPEIPEWLRSSEPPPAAES